MKTEPSLRPHLKQGQEKHDQGKQPTWTWTWWDVLWGFVALIIIPIFFTNPWGNLMTPYVRAAAKTLGARLEIILHPTPEPTSTVSPSPIVTPVPAPTPQFYQAVSIRSPAGTIVQYEILIAPTLDDKRQGQLVALFGATQQGSTRPPSRVLEIRSLKTEQTSNSSCLNMYDFFSTLQYELRDTDGDHSIQQRTVPGMKCLGVDRDKDENGAIADAVNNVRIALGIVACRLNRGRLYATQVHTYSTLCITLSDPSIANTGTKPAQKVQWWPRSADRLSRPRQNVPPPDCLDNTNEQGKEYDIRTSSII